MNERKEIAYRGLKLRKASDGDGRSIEGVAVPFGDIYNDPWDGAETFDRDTVFENADTAKLCYQHAELIGAITSAENRDDGLHIAARIADTQLGRDAVALMDEGALDSLSVGFVPLEDERDENNVTHRRRVRLLEVSLVSWPAYQNAKVENHRNLNTENSQERNHMENETIEKVRAEQAEQARNDYEQISKRDYTGGVLANSDPQPVWISNTLRILEQRRRITNLVSHAALPSEGETLSYPIVTEDTTTVGKQAKEGDYLSYGEIKIGARTATIETYGGYTSLSRQAIERASVPYLDKTLEALVKAYARNTEAATRIALYGAIGDVSASDKIDAGKALTAMTPNDWLDIIIDARLEVEDRNTSLDYLGVSGDVFKAIAHLSDDGDRFMDISGGGIDRLGSIDTTDITGSLLRVPVVLMPGAAAGTAAFLDKGAVTVWENGNSPFQLQDDNVLNLTKDFSVYGYAAFGVTLPEGILPIKFANA